MRMPGVEPGSQAWEACMIPLHYMRVRLLINSLLDMRDQKVHYGAYILLSAYDTHFWIYI